MKKFLPNYWLMKSEPSIYSIDDLKKEHICCWEGIRNYQARNFMRDSFQVGDLAFFYHSNCKIPGISGVMKIHKSSYPDDSSWDPQSCYYDPKSLKNEPRWFMVDVVFIKKFSRYIPLKELKKFRELKGLRVLERGSRLSIQPVSQKHFEFIYQLEKK